MKPKFLLLSAPASWLLRRAGGGGFGQGRRRRRVSGRSVAENLDGFRFASAIKPPEAGARHERKKFRTHSELH
jgi:hypothetical protein